MKGNNTISLADWFQVQFEPHLLFTREYLVSFLKTFGLLVLVSCINAFGRSKVGTDSALIFLYVLPVWYAQQTHCRSASLIAVILTSIAMSLGTVSSAPFNFWFLNLLVLLCIWGFSQSMDSKIATARREAMTDPLTGVLNRRAFEKEAKALFKSTSISSKSQPHAFILADCDRFKQINDFYGHAVGDKALRIVARALNEATDGNHKLGRLGGDEFVLLLPETDQIGARIAVDRLQNALTVLSKDLPFALSISVGVSYFPTDGLTVNELGSKADRRMFRQKSITRVQDAVVEIQAQERLGNQA